MDHVSVWGSVSAVDHRSVAALELMPKGGEVIPLALSRYDTLKKKLETCGGVFGDQADHRAFFPWCMAEKKKGFPFCKRPNLPQGVKSTKIGEGFGDPNGSPFSLPHADCGKNKGLLAKIRPTALCLYQS